MAGRSKKRSSKAPADVADEDTLIRKGASVKAIRTWDDVEHESADEFEASKDKVLLGNKAGLRRRGAASDDESDEEVLGVRAAGSSSEDSSDDKSAEDDGEAFYSDDEEGSDAKANAVEEGAWGKQRYNYYDADDIGTDTDDDEAAAQEEEEEALRLQRQQLEALDEDDFMDEFSTQLGVGAPGDGGLARLVSSTDNGHAQIDLDQLSLGVDGAYDMSEAKRQALQRLPEKEKLKVVQAESPELLALVSDMKLHWANVRSEIRPALGRAAQLGISPDDHPALAFYTAKYQLTMSYLNNIAVYLATKVSTAEERGGIGLRDHPIIGAIVEFRRRLEMMDALQGRLAPLLKLFADELATGRRENADGPSAKAPAASEIEAAAKVKSALKHVDPAASTNTTKARARAESKRTRTKTRSFLSGAATEAAATDSYAELQAMLKKSRASQRANTSTQQAAGWDTIEDGDIGDHERLGAEDVEDKERAIRRLRHHAKRIVQARSKRETRSEMSGDADVPYKHRRTEPLRLGDKAADAVRAQSTKYGDDLDVDLGMDLDSDTGEAAGPQPADDDADVDDYYSALVRSKADAKAEKDARREAQWRQVVEANVAEEAPTEADAKRSVNYQILKNKGMMPRRTKEQRNPRVKRRKRYEKAQKKLNSSVTQVRALEGNYGGEATGIKSGLARSTRFA
ncbi:something about silencing protein 10 [Coemansia guatemalensis]|uniref:Something about silencing protein 10 n=1 Tax=Coemansia guatemalensis TaxID=2761395 RepID=A0A9W8HZX6_9FUNG|nr:something about silencing protein 10 [Coemansia guatemalensis]